ncbi:hypothetical protein ACFL4Z_03350, partial [candidate division KSB1 bacterium]
CPDLDVDAEMKMINNNLSELKKLWNFKERNWDFNIKFVGGELLRVDEDFPEFANNLGDIDGIFIFNLTSTLRSLVNKVVDLGYPSVLFSQPASGHDWSIISDLIKEGKRVDVIGSNDFGELEPFARIMDAVRRLKQSKILCIRSQTQADDYMAKVKNKYGVEIKPMDYSRLSELYDSIDIYEARKEADKFINNAVKVIEPSREDIISANRFYLAVKKLLKEENGNAITIDCLGGFGRGDLKAYPCVAWTRLNDEGLLGVCEADLDSTLTSMMLQFYAGGKPGFVTDPFFDTTSNTVTHAHCVSATKLDGPSGESAPYIIRTHMEDNKGVSVQVKMRVGQVFTSAKIVNADTMLISTGKIISNSNKKRACRTKIVCKVTDPESGEMLNVDKYLHSWSNGLHRVIFYGNYSKDIEKMGRLMGFNALREA